MVGLLVVALTVLVVVAPANAAKPKSGTWFSDLVDPNDENNLSSVQFKVAKSGKKLTKVTIFWRCGDSSESHEFRDPPIPIGVKKKEKFKLIGATTPPDGESSKDFTLKGKFTSRKSGRYSMKLESCGPKTTGQLAYAGSFESASKWS